METRNYVSLSFEWLESDGAVVSIGDSPKRTDGTTSTAPVKVAVVELQRSSKLNGLTLPMLQELSHIARTLSEDLELRGVILTGSGRSFSAGLDFKSAFQNSLRLATSFIPGRHGTNLFQRACWDWRRLPVPVIAVIDGHCLGGGLQLAMGADFRFTTPTSSWSILETKWGLIPDMAGSQTILEALRPDVAKWLVMSGEELSGERAVELGLATRLVTDKDAGFSEARAALAKLASRSPDQISAAKRIFRNPARGPISAFRRERFEQITLLLRENTARARAAGLKKTAPTFTRRGTWLKRHRN